MHLYTVSSRKMRDAKMCIAKVVENDFESSKRVCRSFYLPLTVDDSLAGASASDRFRAQSRRTRIRLGASLPKRVATTLKIHITLIIPRVGICELGQTSAPDRVLVKFGLGPPRLAPRH